MNWKSKARLTGSFLRFLEHGIEIFRLAFRFQSMLALGQSKKAIFQFRQDLLHIFGKPRPEKNDHEKPKQKEERQETAAAVQKASPQQVAPQLPEQEVKSQRPKAKAKSKSKAK